MVRTTRSIVAVALLATRLGAVEETPPQAAALRWTNGHVRLARIAGFSADGSRVLTIGATPETAPIDATACLWDVNEGELLAVMRAARGALVCAAFSPDGEHVATGDGGGTLSFWDGRSGALERATRLRDAAIGALAWVADGSGVWTAGADGHVSFVGRDGDEVRREAVVAVPRTTTIALSADGARLAVTNVDGDVALLRASDASPIGDVVKCDSIGLKYTAGADVRGTPRLDFTPDGRRLIVNNHTSAAYFDAENGEPLPWKCDDVTSVAVAVSAKAGRIALLSPLELAVVDVRDGSVVARKRRFEHLAPELTSSPDGALLVARSLDGKLEMLDATSGDLLASLRTTCDAPIGPSIAFRPDGKELAASTRVGRFDLVALDSMTVAPTGVATEGITRDLAYDPTGRRLVACDPSGGVHFFDPARGSSVGATARHAIESVGVEAVDGDRRLLVTGPWGSRLWDATTGQPIAALSGATIEGPCLLDSRRLVVAAVGRGLRAIDLHNGAVRWETPASNGGAFVHLVALPDQKSFLAFEAANWSGDGSIGYDGPGTLTRRRAVDGEAVWSLAASSNSLWPAVSSDGRRALFRHGVMSETTLIDLEKGRVVTTSKELGDDDSSDSFAWRFTPDGSRLVRARNGTLIVASAENGRLVNLEKTPDGSLSRLEYVSDHRVVADYTFSGLHLLDLDSGGELEWRPLSTADDWHLYDGRFGFVGRAPVVVDPATLAVAVTGEEPHDVVDDSFWATKAVASPDGALLASGGARVHVWSATSGKLLASLDCGERGGGTAVFSSDGKTLLASGDDGAVRLYRTADFSLRATLVTLPPATDGRESEWLAFEPSLHCVGSRGALASVQLESSGALRPLDCFEKLLVDPDAVAASIAGKPTSAAVLPATPEVLVTSPSEPSTRVDARDFRVAARASDAAGVLRFEVLLDGAAVDGHTVESATTLERGGREARLDVALALGAGRSTAAVQLRAWNRRNVASRWSRLEFHYEEPARNLYALLLGVADYDDDRLDLACPGQDVAALARCFEAQQNSFYKEVHVVKLLDRDVSVENVLRQRDEFLLKAAPEDTIVVFAAGHGLRTETNEYWFLTSKATVENPYPGIPRSILESLVEFPKLRAQRRVLLFDTCSAGKALFEPSDPVRGDRGAGLVAAVDPSKPADSAKPAVPASANETEAAAGRDRVGIYQLASCMSDEFAREQKGNGLFTAALVEGLNGAADDAGNRNGLVEIEELHAYAVKYVLDKSGGRQRPTMPRVGAGENFALSRRPKN